MISPIGIEGGEVLLSWVPTGGKKQTAFKVALYSDGGEIYDSGKITSSEISYVPPIRIPYRMRVDWCVTLWDENGVSGEKARSFFETGIGKNDWRAKWIDPELIHPEYCELARDGKPLNPASYLKKIFAVSSVGRARLYITSHGMYTVYLNGVAIEKYFLAPGNSDYEHRLQVQTYDISDMLKVGENEITVTLGEGWWRGSTGWHMTRYCYGIALALLCQIEMDGEPIVVSDESWVASQNGPLGENDTMRIERFDARKEITDWHEVRMAEFGYDNLVATELPVSAHERFSAKLITTPNGQRVLDFGQNFAGYVEIDVTANGGERIVLTHGEVLDACGNFQNDNFQNKETPLCRQVVEYVCRRGRNKYHQTKCYYGFRYALVESELPITGDEFTGVAVYSDMEQTGFFECGVPEVNRLFQNVIWSMKSNFVDIPTDCPHREKLGFTGDCQVFAGAALYLMDCYPVIRRWLRELVSCQADNGCILYIAPPQIGPQKQLMGKDGSAGWSNAITIVPHRIMQVFDSPEEIREFYPAIKRWINYNLEKAKESREENKELPSDIRRYILDCADNWGEWCEPGRVSADYFRESKENGHAEIATAFMAYDCLLAHMMAKRLGEGADAEFFYDVYEKTMAAYRYVFTDNGRISSDRQCHYVRPIAHKLLTDEENKQAADQLAKLIKANGDRIGTGFLTTCHLCETLTDNGFDSVAYDLLLQRQQPSWLFEVEHGATTIWENWFAINKDGERRGSHNHYSLGAVAGWMMSRALGIVVSDGGITLRPYPDSRLGYAKGRYVSPLGEIVSEWRYCGDKIVYTFTVPSNAEADVILPSGSVYRVGAGTHTFNENI